MTQHCAAPDNCDANCDTNCDTSCFRCHIFVACFLHHCLVVESGLLLITRSSFLSRRSSRQVNLRAAFNELLGERVQIQMNTSRVLRKMDERRGHCEVKTVRDSNTNFSVAEI